MEDFNIIDFLKYYLGKIILVILFVFIGLAGSYIYTYYIQVPVYQSQTSLVLAKTDGGNNTITQNEVNLNKNLLSTYRQIVKSRRILDTVIDNLKLDTNYQELSKQVSVNNVSDTELILISVVNEDKRVSRKIANEIAKVFKKEIIDIYNIENVSIIDKALVSKEPHNVNVVKQFVLGAGLGFVLSSMIVVIWFYLDDTIKTEEDIEKKLGLPVLGSVPKYKKKK